MTKRTRQEIDFDDAAKLVDNAERKAAERGMTPAQKERARRQARRKKVTYDLDATLVELVQLVADEIGTSQAGVVNRFLAHALQEWADGQVDFDGWLVQSRSPRFQWLVQVRIDGLRKAVSERIFEGVSEPD